MTMGHGVARIEFLNSDPPAGDTTKAAPEVSLRLVTRLQQQPWLRQSVSIILVFGALSMVWPGIIALFYGVLLLLQSCSTEHEVLALSLAEF